MSAFTGRSALVTGGARGIGAAIVRALAKDNIDVVIGDLLEPAGTALAERWDPPRCSNGSTSPAKRTGGGSSTKPRPCTGRWRSWSTTPRRRHPGTSPEPSRTVVTAAVPSA